MSNRLNPSRLLLLLCALSVAVALPATAQGRGRGHPRAKEAKAPITVSVAVVAAREVLTAQGFEVTRVEVHDDYHLIHYRAGNRGRGRGHGPPARLVIRRTDTQVVLEEATVGLRLEIEIKLGLRIG